MNAIVYLLPIALGLGLTGLVAFLWSLKSGQFDDPQGAASRILIDDGDHPLPGPSLRKRARSQASAAPAGESDEATSAR